MFPTKKAWSLGLLAGAIAASLDILLIITVEQTPSRWVLLESGLFWTVTGWLVVASHSGLSHLRHGVVTTVLINLPWYVLLSFAAGTPEHLPPLMMMSLVFGLGFGWTRSKVFGAERPDKSFAMHTT